MRYNWPRGQFGRGPERISETAEVYKDPLVHPALDVQPLASAAIAAAHLLLVNVAPGQQEEGHTEESLSSFLCVGGKTLQPFVWRI